MPDPLVEGERTDRVVVLPQVDALLERLLIRRAFYERAFVGRATFGDRGGDERFVAVEFLVGEETVDDDEPVRAKRLDLFRRNEPHGGHGNAPRNSRTAALYSSGRSK